MINGLISMKEIIGDKLLNFMYCMYVFTRTISNLFLKGTPYTYRTKPVVLRSVHYDQLIVLFSLRYIVNTKQLLMVPFKE